MKEKTIEICVKFEVKLYDGTTDLINLEPSICNPKHFYFRDIKNGTLIPAKEVKETQLIMKEI